MDSWEIARSPYAGLHAANDTRLDLYELSHSDSVITSKIKGGTNDELYRLVKEFGWDHALEMFRKMYPDLDLSSISKGWFEDGSKFILKLRGLYGDRIIGWKGVHD